MFNKRRFYLFLVVALIVGLALPAVSNAQGEKVLNITSGSTGDIPTIDPQLATDTASHQVILGLFFALVRDLEDKPGNIQPGMAESWVLSEDGMTYTFKIRQGIPWVRWDGSAVVTANDASGNPLTVKAQDFEYSIKRLLDPRTASDYAYVYADIIKGATEFNGAAADAANLDELAAAVAVKALDDATLEIGLSRKIGYAMGIFGMWLNSAVPKVAIDEYGDQWTEPENILTYGPFALAEWKHDESITLVKNPFWPGIENSPTPAFDKVYMRFLDQSASFAEYEAGTLDESPVPLTEMDRVKADPTLSKELYIGPNFCTYYYGYNVTKAPFDDARVRRAFSMAVDRQSIVDNVTKGGQQPALWFSRPGLIAAPTMEDSPELGIGFDPDGAKAELDAYLKEKGIGIAELPPITLMMNQVEGHIKIGEAIQAMWKDVLGVDVQLTTQEWKVYLETLDEDAPQIWRLGWCKDFPDATNFVRDVFRSDSGNNRTKWASADYDKMVDDAAAETDVVKRLEMYRAIEQMLVKDEAVIIPIYWYTSVLVSKPDLVRTYSVSGGIQVYEKFDRK